MCEPGVEAASDPVDADRLRDVGHHLVRRLGPREADVVGDRSREEERVLQDDSELAAVRAQLERPQVVAVHADRAVVGVVEAPDELRGRGLAAAGLADEGEASARRYVDVDCVQHRLLAVGERDAIDVQIALDALRALGAGLVGDLRLRVEHRCDLLHRGAGRLHLPVQVGQLLQRLEDEVEHEDGCDERADRERSAADHLAAHPEHGRHGDDPEELDPREEERVQPLSVRVRPPVRIVAGVELSEKRELAVVRLDHGHPRDRLCDLRGHRRDRLAHAQECSVRAHLEPPREDERRRQDDECDEPEPPVEHEEADDRSDQGERVDDERCEPLGEDVREGVHVRGDPGDDPAGLLLREVLQRQRGQVVEEILAEPEHDVLADAGEPADESRLQDPGERVDDEIDDDIASEASLVLRLHAVVDRVLHDEQRSHGCRRGADADQRQQADPKPAPGEVARQPRQPDAPVRRRPRGRLLVPESLVDSPPMQPH